MSTHQHSRVQPGVPTGGQFAVEHRAEATVELASPSPADVCPECGHGTQDGRLACGPDCNQGQAQPVDPAPRWTAECSAAQTLLAAARRRVEQANPSARSAMYASLHVRAQHVAILTEPSLVDIEPEGARTDAVYRAAMRTIDGAAPAPGVSTPPTPAQRAAAVNYFLIAAADSRQFAETSSLNRKISGPVQDAALLSAAWLASGDRPALREHMYHRIVAVTENEAFDSDAAWDAIDRMRWAHDMEPLGH